MNEDALNTGSAAEPTAFPPVPPPASPADSPPRWRGLALAYVIIAGVAVVGIALVALTGGWVADQLKLYMDETISRGSWPMLTLITAVVAALFCAPLPFLRRLPRVAAVGWAWLGGCAAMAVLGATRVVPVAAGEWQLLVQAVAFSIVAGALWLVARWGDRRESPADDHNHAGDNEADVAPPAPGAFWLALSLGGLTILPWAWFGALGGLWETLLAAAVALAFAAVAAFVVGDRYWSTFAPSPTDAETGSSRTGVSAAARIWGGGSAAGVALLLLSSGVGAAGLQIPIMITLAAMGFAIAAVMSRPRRCGRVVAAAVAPAVFGPLAFADGDEFVLALLNPEIGQWAGIALATAVVTAWIVGLVYGVAQRRIVAYPSAAAALAVVVAAACVAANGVSQPGLHGEKLFVVMEKQADLSGVDGDREQRLTEVHKRLIDTAKSSQKSLRAELDDRGLEYQSFYLVNAIEVDTDQFSRSWLESRDDVAKVLLSPQLRPLRTPAGPDTGTKLDSTDPQPNIEKVGAPKVWDKADGEGITIGISDSGVDGDHPAFADRFRGGDDSWADPVNDTAKPNDPNGHGTHALGLALGGNGVGVAPGAEWIGCTNLPRNAANPADYLSCLQFMLAPYPHGGDPVADGDPTRAPHVLNNSWGCPGIEGCDATVLGGAVRAFDAAGVFFVVSAGNSGPTCGSAKTPPANYRYAYSVGAVNSDDELASFSSRGPVTADGRKVAKPEISAPGVDVISAMPGGGYGPNTGTSMAGPHVAGAVALLWSANPELVGDIENTKDILNRTAAEVTKAEAGSSLDDCGENAAGAGIVDVAKAVSEKS
ncbi:S8 family serine peptidase [Stackebrandtia nassauensis]|uniref:Peptidase S8 and S53 subtilisin kexin sedolisin n=1 Tax=Stackebrandtia nassauensis (strain DSM 44728 / CIP 108903 / NRRL B-16338 / NBRC 102104 / LLR-40K-21) TaxID=446470 RepID=D3PTZ0_STANL|nr:S8 family serine peptidase [Stackebrandtia nassauensis]ADD39748.1 peptidase S8 and S53 subtilisin kexin sedolisin [Stackebrandtia nassauensis DSM 44728]